MSVDRALDTLATGMVASSRYQDVLANNLANANTVGFHKDNLSFRTIMAKVENQDIPRPSQAGLYEDVYYGHMLVDSPVAVDSDYTAHAEGNVILTNNNLDAAIEGKGFFAIKTPQGERYTRAGNFTVNEAGFLITQQGYAVDGVNGPIDVSGESVNILSSGEVQVDGEIRGQLRVVQADDEQDFVKEGNTLYRYEGDAGSLQTRTNVGLQAGYVESSNVNTVEEINAMTINMRAFEANSHAIKTMERTLDRVINSVGKAS